jgi:hypothetical protein
MDYTAQQARADALLRDWLDKKHARQDAELDRLIKEDDDRMVPLLVKAER